MLSIDYEMYSYKDLLRINPTKVYRFTLEVGYIRKCKLVEDNENEN